jgi:hypothetical protein
MRRLTFTAFLLPVTVAAMPEPDLRSAMAESGAGRATPGWYAHAFGAIFARGARR